MAHWIKPKREGIMNYGPGYIECSNCNKKVYIPDEYRFCPYCGEKIENVVISKDYKYNWNVILESIPAE